MSSPSRSSSSATLTLGALGVVYGDIGTIAFIGMLTWARGRELLSKSLRADAIELKPFLKSVLTDQIGRAHV